MRARTGSLWRDPKSGDLYARVTWTDAQGKHDRKRKAMDEAHARTLCAEMLKQIARKKRFQPRRAKTYRRSNLLLYAIQLVDGHTFPVKLGTTNNVQKRMKMVLTHQPHDARLLGAWPATVRDEQDIHAMFKAHNIAREWFRPAPELLAYVEEKSVV